MSFSLAPGISFCEPDGQRVFLNLAQDRYFALGWASNDAFTRLASGDRLSDEDNVRLALLEEAGVLRQTTDDARPAICSVPPVASAVLDEFCLPAPPKFLVLRAAIQLRRAKAEVGRVPLDRLCARFVAQKAVANRSLASPAGLPVPKLARAFQVASRIVGTLDQCLALSLALGRFALAHNLPANIVFGVKVRPFQAHAWLQIGNVVVSDRFDNIRPFTPILVL